jgi:hypothetical protein
MKRTMRILSSGLPLLFVLVLQADAVIVDDGGFAPRQNADAVIVDDGGFAPRQNAEAIIVDDGGWVPGR